MTAKGEVLTPLNDGEVQALAKALTAQGIESVAVCFLHAYANPAHERRVGEILRAASPNCSSRCRTRSSASIANTSAPRPQR